jgi:hypothetical protein
MQMKYLLGLLLLVTLAACSKTVRTTDRVEVYLLQSFNLTLDTSAGLPVHAVSNAVLAATPLVADGDIDSYDQSTHTFELSRNINAEIKDLGADKAFAVTVDRQVIYYGVFQPSYLSSLRVGIALIDPLFTKTELRIGFVNITGTIIHAKDKRNDSQLLFALQSSRRLK